MSTFDVANLRVLVIDDMRTMRKVVRYLLKQIGISDVAETSDGIEALAHLRSPTLKDPDLIICDLHMDNMDGLEFCNQVRREADIRSRAIPIIILTGEEDSLVHDVIMEVGAVAVLTKPVAAPELLLAIQKAIGFA